MKILGIDQGIASLGYCLLHIDEKTKKMCICEYGQLSTYPNNDDDNDMCSRIAYITNTLLEMADDMEPDRICCEKLFFSPPRKGELRNKSASIVNTNIASGLIMYVCGEKDIEFRDYSPLSVKSKIAGDGRAEKEAVRAGVLEMFPELKEDEANMSEHMIDAVGIAATSFLIDGLIDDG